MRFGIAVDKVITGEANGMRLPEWREDVVVRMEIPDKTDFVTHPYLYVESRFGCVPWIHTMVEMFDNRWVLA